jgi:anti-anti-sigma factor
MNIDTNLSDDYAVLSIKGEFDTFHCPRFQEQIDNVVEQGISFIILSMRLVKFINSTALGAIIKASKVCKAQDGALVLSQPSSFVRDIVGRLGIDQIMPVFDDEEQARKHVIKALNAREMAAGSVVSEERVMITFPDETRNQQIGGRKGKKVLLGTMAKVDAELVQFLWSGEKLDITQEQAQQLFFKGSDVHLKFQVKLIKKGYFELDAVIQESQPATDDKVRVVAAFKKISDNEASALSQFAQDMDFLKRQLPGT